MKSIIKKTGALATAALLTLAFATPGIAQDDAKKGDKKPEGAKHGDPAERYAKIDADSDGKVTFEELKKSIDESKRPKKPTEEQIKKMFEKMDKDSSKDVSKEEYVEAAKKMHAPKGDKPKGDKKPKADKKPKGEKKLKGEKKPK